MTEKALVKQELFNEQRTQIEEKIFSSRTRKIFKHSKNRQKNSFKEVKSWQKYLVYSTSSDLSHFLTKKTGLKSGLRDKSGFGDKPGCDHGSLINRRMHCIKSLINTFMYNDILFLFLNL